MSYLGIVPARGGSKGILRKNLRFLGGKPLIAWTIEAGIECHKLDKLVVSTEDPEIARVAEEYGAQIPALRPIALAKDESPTIECIIHMMMHLAEERGEGYDNIVVLQPTSPFRTCANIARAISVFEQSKAGSLVSYCRAKTNPHWLATRKEDGTVSRVFPASTVHQRQSMPRYYLPNGAIYINKWDSVLVERSLRTPPCILYEMLERESVDIDTEMDWQYAEFLIDRK